MDGLGAEQIAHSQLVPGRGIPSQELQDPFMPYYLDEPWLSAIFPLDPMNM